MGSREAAVLSCYDRGQGAGGDEMNDGIVNQASKEAKIKNTTPPAACIES